MNAASRILVAFVVAFAIAACNANGGSSNVPSATGLSGAKAESGKYAKLWGPNVVAACPYGRPGEAQCLALIRTGPQIVGDGGSGPNGGFAPSQLEVAYNLPSLTKGSGQLVAIVDNYDNPNIASDLAYYRSYFGLPPANFTKYNQEGQIGNYPAANTMWGLEEALDVEMVSASCPNCAIALIEGNGSISDLETAETEAVTLGAHIISNSYGCYTPCGFHKSHYDTPGVMYLAGSGDDGYGAGMGDPASFDSVVAVGGTSLYVDSKVARGFREAAWLGTNSGCSREKKPSWQHDPGCSHRTANDVAALADPATGPAIYDTFGFGGWLVGGGTSTGAPFLAGVFGLAGNAASQTGGKTFWEKSRENSRDLYHITHGYNGSCSPTYLCTDGTREFGDYGGPTGWGTPNGIGAF